MNQIQRFIISVPDLVLNYIPQLQNLTTFQKGPFYFGIKVFIHLPISIKNMSHDMKQVKSVLKSFVLINSFYSLEEYFTWILNRDLGSV